MTLDLIILLCLALLGLRGWFRGFVREAMDLVGLVVGILLAFRFGPSVGRVIEAMAGLSPDAGRLAGGIVVFVLVGVGTAVVTRIVERKVALPGLNLMNKVGGAGLGLAWGVFLATLLLTLGVILPMPPSVAETLARFSEGETGTYVVKGTRGTVNGMDGIIVNSITPAAKPLPWRLPANIGQINTRLPGLQQAPTYEPER